MRRTLFQLILSAALVLLISSCATLSGSGVGRVRRYVVESDRVPPSFDGATMAFLSDLHFPSKFTPRRLQKIVSRLRKEAPDVLLFGGDYVPSSEYVELLFSTFSSVKTAYGKYAVLGNHDYRMRDTIAAAMEHAGISLLADEAVCLSNEADSIAVVGVYNPFKPSPVARHLVDSLRAGTFTLLLTHTPDFAQDCDVQCDLVLAGHTHGGQVSLFGLYTPVKNTKYGTRFLRGRNKTARGVPVITTNGVGTSRRKVRFCVPSELVFITLKRISVDK